jgi:O-antigen/teichoic acid export membrane protein
VTVLLLPIKLLRQTPTPTKLHRDVAVAMLDQALLSIFSFALQMLLIRIWSPDQYGVFALFANALLTLSSVHSGLFTTQYAVLVPQARDQDERRWLRTTIFSWNILYCVAASLAVSLIIQGVISDLTAHRLVVGTLYFGASLLREYTRVVMISEGRGATALWTDLVGLLVALLMIALFFRFLAQPDIWQILLSLAVGSAISVAIEISIHRSLYPLSFNSEVRRRYVDIFRRHVMWILVGIATTEVQLRALLFLLGAWYGLATVGVVQAGMILFRPIGVLWFAWSRVMRPVFARAYAEDDDAAAARLSHLSAAAFLVGTLILLAALWLTWPLIDHYVFSHRYPGVGQAVTFWGLVMIVSFVRGTYSVRLQGQARFRELSHLSLIAALLTVGLVVVIAHFFGAIDTILANVAGELFMLGAILWIMDGSPRISKGAIK